MSFQPDFRKAGEAEISKGRLVNKRLVLVFNDQRKSIVSFDVGKKRGMVSFKRLASRVVASSLNQFLNPNCIGVMVNIFVMQLMAAMVTIVFRLDLDFKCHFHFFLNSGIIFQNLTTFICSGRRAGVTTKPGA